jgi:IS30 family transposase
MQKIADALNVSKATISGDLGNCSTPEQLKHAKTASNRKGAGRRKGKQKPASVNRRASQWISRLRQRICDPAIAMIVMAPASVSHHHIAR